MPNVPGYDSTLHSSSALLFCVFVLVVNYYLEHTLSLQIPPVKELRKLMRIQALRCHVIYCQQGAKINVIPVLASRSQALRYAFYFIYIYIDTHTPQLHIMTISETCSWRSSNLTTQFRNCQVDYIYYIINRIFHLVERKLFVSVNSFGCQCCS